MGGENPERACSRCDDQAGDWEPEAGENLLPVGESETWSRSLLKLALLRSPWWPSARSLTWHWLLDWIQIFLKNSKICTSWGAIRKVNKYIKLLKLRNMKSFWTWLCFCRYRKRYIVCWVQLLHGSRVCVYGSWRVSLPHLHRITGIQLQKLTHMGKMDAAGRPFKSLLIYYGCIYSVHIAYTVVSLTLNRVKLTDKSIQRNITSNSDTYVEVVTLSRTVLKTFYQIIHTVRRTLQQERFLTVSSQCEQKDWTNRPFICEWVFHSWFLGPSQLLYCFFCHLQNVTS